MKETSEFISPDDLRFQRVQGPTIPLTPKEKEALVLSARGFTAKDIANADKTKRQTVKNRLNTVSKKLLERDTKSSIWRALSTEEITVEQVFPNGMNASFDKLSPARLRIIKAIAEIPGGLANTAKFLDLSVQTVKGESMWARRELGSLNSAHSTAQYFAQQEKSPIDSQG